MVDTGPPLTYATSMPRTSAPRERQEEFLEPRRICYVATEDSATGAYQYFAEFSETQSYRFLQKFSFKLKVIPSIDGKSSPEYILENIKERQQTAILSGFEANDDSFWIICDVDRWPTATIERVIATCEELGITALFSNPSSDLWIVYHQKDIPEETYSTSDECKTAARALLNKRDGKYENLLTPLHIQYAIQHAESGHRPKSEKWPKNQGTHIYKLVNFLIK